jgi:hypothetical protein
MQNEETMTYDFSLLSDPFTVWYDQHFQRFGEHLIEPESDNHLEILLHEKTDFIQSLGLTLDEFEANFLAPYLKLSEQKKLTFEALQIITDMQSRAIGHRPEVLYDGEIPLLFKVEPTSLNYFDSLDWTIFNIYDLNLPEFEFIEGKFMMVLDMPYRQCRYCGRKDHYYGKDNKKILFNNKQRYCHAKGCDFTSLSNPELHKQCCYGQWGLIKKSFKQRLYRNADYMPEAKRIFIDFCNERLEKNLNQVAKIRSEDRA